MYTGISLIKIILLRMVPFNIPYKPVLLREIFLFAFYPKSEYLNVAILIFAECFVGYH